MTDNQKYYLMELYRHGFNGYIPAKQTITSLLNLGLIKLTKTAEWRGGGDKQVTGVYLTKLGRKECAWFEAKGF